MSWQWISTELALAIYQRQLAEHGGLSGIREKLFLSIEVLIKLPAPSQKVLMQCLLLVQLRVNAQLYKWHRVRISGLTCWKLRRSDHESDKLKAREALGSGPIQNFLATNAKKYTVWVVSGKIPMVADDDCNKARAACLVYKDKGERTGRYDKIHLFDVNVPGTNEVYRESDSIEPVTQSLVVDTPFGKLGIAICDDLRFHEISKKGLEILVVPWAFTADTGAAHWEILLRARFVKPLLRNCS